MGDRQNVIWGIGAVDVKMQGGYARGGVKKDSRRGGAVEVKETQEGCLMCSRSEFPGLFQESPL